MILRKSVSRYKGGVEAIAEVCSDGGDIVVAFVRTFALDIPTA